MDEVLTEFIDESRELLETAENQAVALEQMLEPGQIATCLDGLFRIFHTLKGNSRFIQLNRLETVAHTAENVLTNLRQRAAPVDSQTVSDLLAAIDMMRAQVDCLETGDKDGPAVEALMARLVVALGRLETGGA